MPLDLICNVIFDLLEPVRLTYSVTDVIFPLSPIIFSCVVWILTIWSNSLAKALEVRIRILNKKESKGIKLQVDWPCHHSILRITNLQCEWMGRHGLGVPLPTQERNHVAVLIRHWIWLTTAVNGSDIGLPYPVIAVMYPDFCHYFRVCGLLVTLRITRESCKQATDH